MQKSLNRFVDLLQSVSVVAAKEQALHLASVFSPEEVVEMLLVPALDRIGAAWEEGELSISQVYISGRVCEEIVEEMLPRELPESSAYLPVALAVLEDFHMLGKRILHSTLRAYGLHVMDFGRVTVEEAVSKVTQHDVRILLVSTLMLPSAMRVKNLCRELQDKGLQVTIVVGGAPFRLDPELWREVGADYTAATAMEGARMVLRLLEQLP